MRNNGQEEDAKADRQLGPGCVRALAVQIF